MIYLGSKNLKPNIMFSWYANAYFLLQNNFIALAKLGLLLAMGSFLLLKIPFVGPVLAAVFQLASAIGFYFILDRIHKGLTWNHSMVLTLLKGDFLSKTHLSLLIVHLLLAVAHPFFTHLLYDGPFLWAWDSLYLGYNILIYYFLCPTLLLKPWPTRLSVVRLLDAIKTNFLPLLVSFFSLVFMLFLIYSFFFFVAASDDSKMTLAQILAAVIAGFLAIPLFASYAYYVHQDLFVVEAKKADPEKPASKKDSAKPEVKIY